MLFDLLKLVAVAAVAGIGWTVGARVGSNLCDYVADTNNLPRQLVAKCADLFRQQFGREPSAEELAAIAKMAS